MEKEADPCGADDEDCLDVGADVLSNIYPPGGGASVTSQNGRSAKRKLLAAVFN